MGGAKVGGVNAAVVGGGAAGGFALLLGAAFLLRHYRARLKNKFKKNARFPRHSEFCVPAPARELF